MIYSYLLFQTIQNGPQKKTLAILVYAQMLTLISVALLLLGLAVTISSVGATLLCLIGLSYYFSIVFKLTPTNF